MNIANHNNPQIDGMPPRNIKSEYYYNKNSSKNTRTGKMDNTSNKHYNVRFRYVGIRKNFRIVSI